MTPERMVRRSLKPRTSRPELCAALLGTTPNRWAKSTLANRRRRRNAVHSASGPTAHFLHLDERCILYSYAVAERFGHEACSQRGGQLRRVARASHTDVRVEQGRGV